MTDREPDAEELAQADADVEAHSIEEYEEGDAAILDVNLGCGVGKNA